MRRFSALVALFVLAALCFNSTAAFAQRGQGGPGGFGGFGGFGGMRGGGGASALLGMLRMPEVRTEVKVSDEAYKAVEEAQQANREKMGNFREMSEDERTKLMAEMNTQAQEMLDEVLEPAGMKRLMGLYVQQSGTRAVTNTLIAKEIGLDEAGIKKVTEATTKAGEEMRSKMEELRGAGGQGQGEFDREKFTAMMQESQKKTDEAILAALTEDQKKALEALKGEKFTFPERSFGPGGPGGQGGQRGGGRPRPTTEN